MKLPGQYSYEREWIVGEEVWELKFVKNLGFDGHGECCPESRTMAIKQGQPKDEILKTFFHEVCHALEFTYDIEIPHNLVYSFEEAWFRFFVDNWEAIAQLVMCSKADK